ncbi:MAG: hypothetical protein WB615_09075 [Candidatus Tumulicola sp.]
MKRFLLLVSVFALSLGGCGGGTGNPTPPAVPAAVPAYSSLHARGELPRFLRLGHTPALPPLRRHQITGADRARAQAGGWTPVTAASPFVNGPGTAMLMTDGTILVQDSCTPNWFALVPDKNGNYVTGSWTAKAAMPSNYGPLYFASAVLPDGKLIVNGGEYNFCDTTETTLGAIYDPVANAWTAVAGPSGWTRIGDGQSTVLQNGTYMLGNCCSSVQALLNESSMTWTQIGTGKQDANSEEGWTLLRNGSVLVANVLSEPFAQVYVPKANAWSAAGELPVDLVAAEEIGPQTLRPDNTVFVAGATGNTAIYHAAGGTWTQGPTFPVVGGQQLDVADGPSTVLPNGVVMLPASPGIYHAPATFFTFNGKKLVTIAAPPNAVNDSTYNVRLLTLPTGQVLETDGSNDVEIYTAKSKSTTTPPTISSVPTSLTHGVTYQIKGKRFNGLTQGSMYGDDAQQATNYPLVRIVNDQTGHVFYARTHDHSFMGVASGRVVSTRFDVPAAIETGPSTLVVVANGIASQPVAVTIN